jgi:predicted phosphodiesterase
MPAAGYPQGVSIVMRIVCISDTHNRHEGIRVPDGDVLIHAGDGTGTGTFQEIAGFLCWMDGLPHRHKILIAGNHDWLFDREPDMARNLLKDHQGITYLQDSGCEVGGLKFWGSPWQPWFMSWAFNLPRGLRMREKWNLIPFDTEVLVTHGPPHGVLDQVRKEPPGGWEPDQDPPEHLGCEELRIRALSIRPRLHMFGHIHGGYGIRSDGHTTFVNASICDEDYHPVNPPVVMDL